MHEYSRKLSLTKDPLTMTHLATSIDGMFCRKRGRPPKNRVIEVWNDYVSRFENSPGQRRNLTSSELFQSPIGGQSLMDSPQAIFTSFKLPKPSTAPSSSKDVEQHDSNDDRSSSPTPSVSIYKKKYLGPKLDPCGTPKLNVLLLFFSDARLCPPRLRHLH